MSAPAVPGHLIVWTSSLLWSAPMIHNDGDYNKAQGRTPTKCGLLSTDDHDAHGHYRPLGVWLYARQAKALGARFCKRCFKEYLS